MPQRFSYPVVEKLHLLGGVEPMLTAIEYGKRGIVGIGETRGDDGIEESIQQMAAKLKGENRKAVAIIKPMVDLEEEDFADVVLDDEE